jgi:hypothetical protein
MKQKVDSNQTFDSNCTLHTVQYAINVVMKDADWILIRVKRATIGCKLQCTTVCEYFLDPLKCSTLFKKIFTQCVNWMEQYESQPP